MVTLNLSRNNLSGEIPQEIGGFKHLSGQISPGPSQIDHLNTLDSSSNNSWGKIPMSPQIQTCDATAYTENPELCRTPLRKKCLGEKELKTHVTTEDAREMIKKNIIS